MMMMNVRKNLAMKTLDVSTPLLYAMTKTLALMTIVPQLLDVLQLM
jgi:hypothetical protein